MYAPLYAIERIMFQRLKIFVGLLSVLLLLLTSLDFIILRVSSIKDADTGVIRDIEVRVLL